MSHWKKITEYLETASWITKVASWTKVPELVVLNNIVKILTVLLDITKKRILKINQNYSDVVIDRTADAEVVIEEERKKPLPVQNNDVLREQARGRHNGNSNG